MMLMLEKQPIIQLVKLLEYVLRIMMRDVKNDFT